MDLLPLARPAAVEFLPFSLRADFANSFVFGVAPTLSTGRHVDTGIDYKAHYYANHRAFFILFALFIPVDILDSLLKGLPHFLSLGPIYFASGIFYSTGLIIAAVTRRTLPRVLRDFLSHRNRHCQFLTFSTLM